MMKEIFRAAINDYPTIRLTASPQLTYSLRCLRPSVQDYVAKYSKSYTLPRRDTMQQQGKPHYHMLRLPVAKWRTVQFSILFRVMTWPSP